MQSTKEILSRERHNGNQLLEAEGERIQMRFFFTQIVINHWNKLCIKESNRFYIFDVFTSRLDAFQNAM